ncbi:MAG: replication factor C large subunit [Candidatus Syntropharchaeia archaeon]
MDWTERYRPRSLIDVVGNENAVRKFLEWAESWEGERKPAILYGNPGTGKTSAAYALAHDLGWEVLELNASDERTASAIREIVGIACSTMGLCEKKRLIILDEADNIYEGVDRGGTKEIAKILEKTHQPIVLIANDLYGVPKMLRERCILIQFRPLRMEDVKFVLRRICNEEGVDAEEEAIEILARNSLGDLRSAINDLQAMIIGKKKIRKEDIAIGRRDSRESVFRVLSKIFEGNDIEEGVHSVYNLDMAPDTFIHWIHENLPLYEGEDLSRGFSFLSRADVFLGRVRRKQNYRLWRYASILMSGGILSAKSRSYPPLRYKYPSLFRKLAGRKKKKEDIKNTRIQKEEKISITVNPKKEEEIEVKKPKNQGQKTLFDF